MIRQALDRLYDGAAIGAALCMVGLLAMIIVGIAGRLVGFNLPGADAYAGYCMAGAAFLALAHTLKHGEHVRVTLLLARLAASPRRWLDLLAHAAGALLCTLVAYYSVRLVWLSWSFGDVSQSSDATPLWIPQGAMAIGAVLLAVAMFDELLLRLHGHAPAPGPDPAGTADTTRPDGPSGL